MKYKLINENIYSYNATQTILTNRGISLNEIYHYLNTTDSDICDMCLLGESTLREGAAALIQTIKNNERVFLVVDSDADGYTSSALLLNYLYDLFPAFVKNNIDYYIHDGKEHGLSDCIDMILESNYKLVICPDSSSNDYEEHRRLSEKNVQVLVLD